MAHTKLLSVSNFTLEEAQHHQERANLVAEVVQGIQNALSPTIVDQSKPSYIGTPSGPPSQVPTQESVQEQALYTGRALPFALAQQMQQMQEMQTLLTQLMTQSLNTGTTGHTQNQGTHQRCQRPRNCYCWTHGACGHTREECRTRADGHQMTATFQNRMGGSTRNVRNANT